MKGWQKSRRSTRFLAPATGDSDLDSLRDDPRFTELLSPRS